MASLTSSLFCTTQTLDTQHAGQPEPVSCSQARRFIACLDDGALLITDAVCVLLPGIEIDGFIYVEKLLDKFD
jgi:hypothetical protein